MKPKIFSRKIRQFKTACSELESRLKNDSSDKSSILTSLILKIKKLARELAVAFNWSFVKKAMGSAAFMFGVIFNNQAMAQHFLEPVENPFSLQPAYYFAFPALADLDSDGDYDLLVYEYYGQVQYYENIGTPALAIFDAPVANGLGTSDVYYIGSPTFVDIDNDGDLDLFVGEYYANLQFFENVGTPTEPEFGAAQLDPFGFATPGESYFVSPTFADLDGDGDFDMLISNAPQDAYNLSEILYYENEGTAELASFGEPEINPFEITDIDGVVLSHLIDLDNDGDFDLLQGDFYGGFTYHENTGTASNPIMSVAEVNPFNLTNTYDLTAIAYADMDDDGDIDLLVGQLGEYGKKGSYYDSNFQYFENAPELSVGEFTERLDLSVFPNPSSEFITVESSEIISRIEIIDVVGRACDLVTNPKGKIDISQLDAGNYMVRVTLRSGETGVTRFIKD
ncbi:MAG: T9SS type A sorting domain-containing protein [Flavobacteriales bacterium]